MDDQEKALLDIKSMVHPCVKLVEKKLFVPNDTYICSDVLLVTGPNMGGKSTILR